MYFAERPQVSNEDLTAHSLELLQTHYKYREHHYSICHSLPIISEALPNDGDLSDYLFDFHVNGRVASCLQLRETRPWVAGVLAESLQDVDPDLDRTITVTRHLSHIQDPENPEFAIGTGDSHLTQLKAYDLTWPTWRQGKTRPTTPPCDVDTWRKLKRRKASGIVAKLTELEEAKGDHPQAAIMTAAVGLISARCTAPDSAPGAPSAHMAILTAPGRLATAQEVLRASKSFYSRGALSIASALARADRVESWDTFQAQTKAELAEISGEGAVDSFILLSIPAGIDMAMRQKRYDAALDMAKDVIPLSSPSPSVLRALCTIVSKFAFGIE